MSDMVMDNKLKEKIELSILFDFYGELLKNHNKQIFEDYVLNDLSLSEIAEEQGISRQGVHDIVKRCSKLLRDYEEILNLVKKFNMAKVKVNRIKELTMLMRADNLIYDTPMNYDTQLYNDTQLSKNIQLKKDTQLKMDTPLNKEDELTGFDEIIQLTDDILHYL